MATLGQLYPNNQRTVMGIAGNQGPPTLPGSNVYTPALEGMRNAALMIPEGLYQAGIMARYPNPEDIPAGFDREQFMAYANEQARREEIARQYPQVYGAGELLGAQIDPFLVLGMGGRPVMDMAADIARSPAARRALGQLFRDERGFIAPFGVVPEGMAAREGAPVFSALSDEIPRVEFSDAGAAFNRAGLSALKSRRNMPMPLNEVLHHPLLEEALPGHLKDIKIQVDPKLPPGDAAFNIDKNIISVSKSSADNPDALLPDIMHEVQHTIQEKFGMATGISPKDVSRQQMLENYSQRYGEAPAKDMIQEAAAKKVGGDDTMWKRMQFNTYNRFAGEGEARYVAERVRKGQQQLTDPRSGFYLTNPPAGKKFSELSPAILSRRRSPGTIEFRPGMQPVVDFPRGARPNLRNTTLIEQLLSKTIGR